MFIGLDLGTSGLKGILIDQDQAVLAEATAPLTVQRPQDGWSEQLPADWIAAAESVLDALAAAHDLSDVRGIGLSGHMHGATLLDASDQVLRPVFCGTTPAAPKKLLSWTTIRCFAGSAAISFFPALPRQN